MKKSILSILSFTLYFISSYSQPIYGLMQSGGELNSGAIIEADSNGNYKKSYSFPSYFGSTPYYLNYVEADSGILLGMTNQGRNIFEYNYKTNTYKNLYNLNDSQGNNLQGSLIKGSNGKFYGLSYGRGRTNSGTIFEYNYQLNKLTVLHHFSGGLGGFNQFGDLVEYSPGVFYGLCHKGGINNFGILFEFNANTLTFTKKHDFTLSSGTYPYGKLIKASNGKLYGSANEGGTNSAGVFFQFDVNTNTYSPLHHFSNATTGSYPYDLIEYSNGIIYGSCSRGGANLNGTIYKYTIATNTLTKEYDFIKEIGRFPFGLMKATDNMIYGVCSEGGAYTVGTVFKFNTSTKLADTINSFNIKDGARSACKLMQAKNGKLYGCTILGGTIGQGVMFEVNITNKTFNKLFDFGNSFNGSYPVGQLFALPNNVFLGACSYGGLYNRGTLFKFDGNTKKITNIYDFKDSFFSPTGQFIKAKNNLIYSICSGSKSGYKGAIYSYNESNNEIKYLKEFNDSIGFNPSSNLIEPVDGALVGTAYQGGSYQKGTIYSYHIQSNTLSRIISFNNINGNRPTGNLCKASNGKYYGTTNDGGTNNLGIIFEMNPQNNVISTVYSFTQATGSNPASGLLNARDGLLYGLNQYGGQYDEGSLFNFNPNTNTYSNLISFNDSIGSYPEGGLMQANNDLIYGSTNSGGVNNIKLGGLFEYNISTGKLIHKFYYNDTIGRNPYSTYFQIYKPKQNSTISKEKNISILVFPNPFQDELTIQSTIEFNQYQLFDYNGKMINEGKIEKNKIQIKDLSSGIYFLKTENNLGDFFTVKIIKN